MHTPKRGEEFFPTQPNTVLLREPSSEPSEPLDHLVSGSLIALLLLAALLGARAGDYFFSFLII